MSAPSSMACVVRIVWSRATRPRLLTLISGHWVDWRLSISPQARGRVVRDHTIQPPTNLPRASRAPTARAIQSPRGQHSTTGQALRSRPEGPGASNWGRNSEGPGSGRCNPIQSPAFPAQDTSPNPDRPAPVSSAWPPVSPAFLPACAEFPCGPRGLHPAGKNPLA
jgi:hypothetical protein